MRSDRRYWPVTASGNWDGSEILLRPFSLRRDVYQWEKVTSRNQEWTANWEATSPIRGNQPTFAAAIRAQHREARNGGCLPWVLTVDGELSGAVRVSSIVQGAFHSGVIGYWIDQDQAGRSIIPYSVAMAMDFMFVERGLHRAEICIRPENRASVRVVEKLGMRNEGMRKRLLHINGQWRDHHSYALTTEELRGENVVDRFTRRMAAGSFL